MAVLFILKPVISVGGQNSDRLSDHRDRYLLKSDMEMGFQTFPADALA